METDRTDTALVTDIQRYSVNDGPGFRTNVYLKGCPLHCSWCHNPETISPQPDLLWKKRSCVQCGACLDACEKDAIVPPIPPEEARQEGSVYHKIRRDKCDLCMACVDVCRYDALEISGTPMSIEEIMTEVEADLVFFHTSGGGMTLGGGEPTMQPDFSRKLLAEAKRRGLHTCLDTNGFCKWETLESLLPYTDIVLYDLKHIDTETHKAATGADCRIIMENLEKLSAAGKEIWVRIPVVPGFNDTRAFHEAAARYLADLPARPARVDLLPFHNWCQDKYESLGIDWSLKETEALSPFFLEVPAEIYRQKGLYVSIGGSGFEEPTGTESS